MDLVKFDILEFKLDKMAKGAAILLIAKRGSGKSFIARDIMYHYRHLPAGVVLAPTDRMNPFYKKFVPDLFIHYEVDINLIQKILTRQRLMIDKAKRKRETGLYVDPGSILIMDDCLAQRDKWATHADTREILMNGRHYKLAYLLTMQDPIGVPPNVRLNFDYVFVLKNDSIINLKKIRDNYVGMIADINMFATVLEKCTEDYKAMVIDNRKPSLDIQEKVYWFKARERKFTFGSQKYVELHNKHYNKDYMIDSLRKSNFADLVAKNKKKPQLEISLK